MDLKCLIVDDEPIARDILRTYCQQLQGLQVVGALGNALEARAFMLNNKVDVLFLDINMPVLDGLSFLSTVKRPPSVIFTTAYREYAVDAFELSAVDYLVKPFSFERFIQAIDKVSEKIVSPTVGTSIEGFFIQVGPTIHRILLSDWLYAEAQGNNTKVVTTASSILPYIAFNAFEELIPPGAGIRVHRSFLVNKNKIIRIEGGLLLVGDRQIPIGSHYRNGLLQALGLK